MPEEYTPIEVAVALSLYQYNVSANNRARALCNHFRGDSIDRGALTFILAQKAGNAATELPMPTAKVYVDHALERYGEEAKERVAANS